MLQISLTFFSVQKIPIFLSFFFHEKPDRKSEKERFSKKMYLPLNRMNVNTFEKCC